MQPFRYRIVLEWNEEDRLYVGRVPAFPGLAAHGTTPEEAAKEARTAALAMLEVMAEDHDEPPPEDARAVYSGQLRIRMPPLLHELVSRGAAAEGVSLNQEIISLLSREVGLSTRVDEKRKPKRKPMRRAAK
jgi:predicted RNase H-like HicB family nuclease